MITPNKLSRDAHERAHEIGRMLNAGARAEACSAPSAGFLCGSYHDGLNIVVSLE